MKFWGVVLTLLLSASALTVVASESELIAVNTDNYVEAKTALHFQRVLKRSGGINRLVHLRQPTPLDQQRVTRMNRDTLYSSAVVDISKGATLILPDSGQRYLSAAVVNEQHYVNHIFHGAGQHSLTAEALGSDFVMLVVRVFVNANDPKDIQLANGLQDLVQINSASARPYSAKPFAADSLKATTATLAKLGTQLTDAKNTYGAKGQVDPVRHLLGTAYGWGGLPESEVVYLNAVPKHGSNAYQLTVADVPVDGFWSVSVYNEAGYFQKNDAAAYSVNNYTAEVSADGVTAIHLGGDPHAANYLPFNEGWSYVVRMYRPHKAILEGKWRFPAAKPL